MTEFALDPPALTRGGLNRSEDLRNDATVVAAWPTARVLLIDEDDRFPIHDVIGRSRLALVPAARFGSAPPAGAVLVGALGESHYWAVPVEAQDTEGTGSPAAPPDADRAATWASMRLVGPLLSDDDAAVATTAVALVGWHRRARFCVQCGLPTVPDPTGHSRACAAGHQEFPRTDPAVIVLVHDDAGSAVLARQPSWQPGRFSVLAGFTEAGESLESTVVREMGEEIGVSVDAVRYLGSQPWPFPRSLMIAFAARAPRGAVLTPRPGEIERAAWFSRRELAAMLAAEANGHGVSDTGITLPGPMSIARRMVEAFVRSS